MKLKFDKETAYPVGAVLAVLIIGTVVGQLLKLFCKTEGSAKTIQNLNARVKAWWVMVAVFGLAMFIGAIGSVVLFGLISFLALREFITLTPTKLGDHRTLFWVFFIITPLQYYLVATHRWGSFPFSYPSARSCSCRSEARFRAIATISLSAPPKSNGA